MSSGSVTASPVSLNGHSHLGLNYESEEDDTMQVDSDADNINSREPDADADGESVDDDISPPPTIMMPVDSHLPLSHHRQHNDSVCLSLSILVPLIVSTSIAGHRGLRTL